MLDAFHFPVQPFVSVTRVSHRHDVREMSLLSLQKQVDDVMLNSMVQRSSHVEGFLELNV